MCFTGYFSSTSASGGQTANTEYKNQLLFFIIRSCRLGQILGIVKLFQSV